MKEIKFEGVTYFEEGGKYFVIDGFGKHEEVTPLTASMIMERAIKHAESLAEALEQILDSYESQQLRDSLLDSAKAALAAYRGEA